MSLFVMGNFAALLRMGTKVLATPDLESSSGNVNANIIFV